MHLGLSVILVYKHQPSMHVIKRWCYISNLNNHHDFPKLNRDVNVTCVDWYQWLSWAMANTHFQFWYQNTPAYKSAKKYKTQVSSFYHKYWIICCKKIPPSELNCSEFSFLMFFISINEYKYIYIYIYTPFCTKLASSPQYYNKEMKGLV